MKKFLSLVLALVMTMSLVTVSAGAKDFTDASKITYDEAVAVMSAAKVIDGYAEGDFRPANTLTRGAAAKIICNLILGPTTASALVADAAPYKDVPTNHTFAGYIAYCQKTGIISGYADGTFKPANTLTGYAFMKMLLGALGYDAATEGYTGPNWSINVAKRALNIGLDDDLTGDFNGVKAVNREEACLYAFNTLKATMVEYENNNSVTVNGITFTNKSTAKDMVNNAKVETIKEDNKMQFAEKYFDKLTGKDATDDFGRPATEWKYDGDKIGTYADSADDSMVINKSLDGDVVLSTNSDYFGYTKKDFASSVDAYINGDQVTGVKGYDTLNALKIKAGDQVEVFENDDDKVETIAVIRYSLAVIDEVDTKLSSTYTKKGATYSITLKALDEDVSIGGTYYDKYDNDSAKELAGFAADTYKADTAIAVALNSKNVVLASHVADSVSGKVTGYDKGSKANVTVDGTKYPLHDMIMTASSGKDGVANSGLANSFNYNDTTYTVYTDVNGYVIGIDETESVKIEDVYYVTGIAKEDGKYSDSYYAQAVALADGSVVEFKLKTSDTDTQKAFFKSEGEGQFKDAFEAGKNIYTAVAGLYTFDKDGSKYTVQRYVGKDVKIGTDESYMTNDSTYYVYGKEGTAGIVNPAAIGDDLEKADTKMSIDSKKVYLNDKTTYIKVENDGDDISVKTVVGGTNVKEINGKNATTAIAVATKSNSNYVASYVILVSKDFANTSGDDVVFVASTSNKTVTYTDADGKSQKGYQVDLYMLDGSGKVEEGVTITKDSNKGAGYYTYTINDDGVYELDDYSYNDAEAAAKNTVFETAFKDGKYDDETGYYKKAELKSIYSNSLTVKSIAGYALDDVDFASNVIIADDRGSSTIDKDMYNSEITSVSALKSAIDKSGNKVIADVYYDNGEVVMVYVWSMEKAKDADDGEDVVDAKFSNVSASTTDSTTTIKVTMTSEVTEDTDVKVALSKESNSGWLDMDTYTVTVAKDAKEGTVAVKNLPAGNYKLTVGSTNAFFTVK